MDNSKSLIPENFSLDVYDESKIRILSTSDNKLNLADTLMLHSIDCNRTFYICLRNKVKDIFLPNNDINRIAGLIQQDFNFDGYNVAINQIAEEYFLDANVAWEITIND